MNSKLNVKQWLIAAIAVFVVWSILDFLLARLILEPLYPQMFPGPSKPEDLMMLRVWNYLGRAIFSLMFVFLFAKGYEGKPGVGEGLRYGLWIWLFIFVPGIFAGMVMSTAPVGFLVVGNVAAIIKTLVCGVIVGLIYKGQPKLAA